MSLHSRFHGDVGGTRDEYGPDLGRESIFGSPSSSMTWSRSLSVCLIGRIGDDGGCPLFRLPLGGEGGDAAALSLARVGACADEVHSIRVERDQVPNEMGKAGRDEGSLSRKSSRACGPPAMERM